MAKLITSDLTLGAREAETVSSVIFERVFNESDLAEYHDIETGIDVKTQIAFAGRLGLLGKVQDTDSCAPEESDGFVLSEKFWTPVLEEFRLRHCQKDLDGLIKIFRKAQRVNPDFFDAVGSEDFGIIIAAVETALKENIHRKVWFNDKQAAIQPTGVFTTGTDLDYFNSFDGLFKQIFVDVTANKISRVPVSVNAAATYTAQQLPEDAALGILEKLVTTADERLVAADDAFILVTRSIADNYRASLRNKNLGSGFVEVVEQGRPKLYFDGIEIKVRYDWDRYIKTYQNNGTKYNLPHRAVFTTKSNIPVGTLSDQDLAKLDVFYDKTQKANFIDAAYTIDAKLLEDYMVVAAY
ncbi:hypothetical protein GR160_08665 [Flavobacterium sp. Sd200]|uniref:hypothetical protein n=1 Tax=Flavobacterium sp. Sd200 TaxID=2692211 RepID=UPI00137002CE|nr:hypothetical protein [Flavobacterium sp. Sd200]MXN91300.1 hypothetical protein [Flavobacterium sp. Sd200]